jgi:hypothetical protein
LKKLKLDLIIKLHDRQHLTGFTGIYEEIIGGLVRKNLHYPIIIPLDGGTFFSLQSRTIIKNEKKEQEVPEKTIERSSHN